MTSEEWNKLDYNQKQIKIAELCGDKKLNGIIPSYTKDLNVIHEVEKKLVYDKMNVYWTYKKHLKTVCNRTGMPSHMATAEQRAEALIITLTNEK